MKWKQKYKHFVLFFHRISVGSKQQKYQTMVCSRKFLKSGTGKRWIHWSRNIWDKHKVTFNEKFGIKNSRKFTKISKFSWYVLLFCYDVFFLLWCLCCDVMMLWCKDKQKYLMVIINKSINQKKKRYWNISIQS